MLDVDCDGTADGNMYSFSSTADLQLLQEGCSESSINLEDCGASVAGLFGCIVSLEGAWEGLESSVTSSPCFESLACSGMVSSALVRGIAGVEEVKLEIESSSVDFLGD